ncbi:MAG TPA: polysaccharide export protein [Gammaproteobacteria bacterium]|nr:polysaccharide export protein [Gammaproteobacteria bacterium]
MTMKRLLQTVLMIVASAMVVTACGGGPLKKGDSASAPSPESSSTPVFVASAQDASQGYRIQPGDKLEISVYGEDDLQKEITVGPGGGITFPLIGDMNAKGKTVDELRTEVKQKLKKFIPEAVVTVSIKEVVGNKVSVLGQVKTPGEYVLTGNTDVMQALSMAGGVTPFAALKKIKILRRDPATQKQSVIKFNYADVIRGKHLEQNILLRSGDTIVVP